MPASPDAPASPAPFGPGAATALLLGVMLVQAFARLPATAVAVALLLAGMAGWSRPGLWRLAGAFLAGLGLACLHGQAALAQRLPPALAGQTVLLEGRVTGLPVADEEAWRFTFRVESGEGAAAALQGRTLRLAWFFRTTDERPTIDAGGRWRLPVKLRESRGPLNEGAFDLERRALEQRIAGSGLVQSGRSLQALAPGRGLDAWRGGLSSAIGRTLPGQDARFVQALALGDTRALTDHDWEVLRATGLTHLIAISGFHVGLVAGFGALLVHGLYRIVPGLGRRMPRPQATGIGALLLALAYTLLAGAALPTVRTLLMIAVVLLARLWRRPASAAGALSLALVAILVADPLSVLAPGFWLSFLGVAWLVWCLPHVRGQGWLRPYLASQGVAVVGLLPVTVAFFGQASLAGPVVNLFGIPWISLGVVPLAIAGVALHPLWPEAGAWAWLAAGAAMDGLWVVLEWIATWRLALVWLPVPAWPALLLAGFGAFWCLLPRGVPGRLLALLLFLPLFWPARDRIAPGEVDLQLIDVGQGLALLVRTHGHALLYDAGPASPRGLDFGEAVVVPSLRQAGVRRLDRLMVSHGDNDHAGGVAAVRRAFPVGDVLAPPGWAGPGMRPCEAGQAWEWDGVRFRVLHPPAGFPYLRNESSCVLRIDTAGASALVPGDIGRHVEARLSRLPPADIRADLLLSPHHGSDTSSSLNFLAAVRPAMAWIAVGHDNRFGLPKPRVLARYRRYGVEVHDSAGEGALGLRLGPEGLQRLRRLRRDAPRYWRHAGAGGTGYAIEGFEPNR